MVDVTAHTLPSLTQVAAATARSMGDGDVEKPVREKVSLVLLDFLGCCMEASRSDAGRNMLAYADIQAGSPRGAQGAFRQDAGAEVAALVHGMLGHALIREDMHVPSGTHPGVVILPAMLALARREQLSGEALARGVAAGYHAMGALGAAVRTGLKNRHFRPLGVSGAFGATAGAIAAIRADAQVAVDALAFAANFASGFNQWPRSGGQEIYVHAGMAARNALVALDLARAGLRASPDILEGEDGLFRAMGSGPEASKVFLRALDGPNCLLDVTHKPTAGCNFVQTAAAAALRLNGQIGTGAYAGIQKIVISTFSAARAYPGCDNAGPFDYVEQRKMSFQFAICAALRHGRLDSEIYSRRPDIDVQRLIDVTEIRIDQAFESRRIPAQPARVEIFLHGGQHLACELPDVPWLDPESVRRRFDVEAGPSLSHDDRQRLGGLIANIWDVPDTSDLFALLEKAG